MNNFQIFLSVCVPSRLALIILSFVIGNFYPKFIPLAILLAVAISLGFLFAKTEKGAFGSVVYWNRKVHSVLFLLFAFFMYFYPRCAYILLALDLIYGIFTVFDHYKLQ